MIQASGCIFLSLSTNRVMFQQRSSTVTHANTWGFFGGKSENDERPIETLLREIEEELGSLPDIIKSIPIEKFTHTKNNFIYETFVNIVEDEFIPNLNHEHVGYAWVDVDHFPKPLHPGLYQTLNIDSINEKIKTLVSQWSDD